MEAFREFLLSFRPQHFAIGAPANLLINTLVMWFVANQLTDTGEKVSLLRCAICAVLLYLTASASIALLLFPIPLVFIMAAVIWLVVSLVVIRSVFQLTHQSGALILFLYLLIFIAIHGVVKQIM